MGIELRGKNGAIDLSRKMWKGDDGGYYIPSLDSEGNLTWAPSETEMPAVEGANIKGQKGDTGTSGVWVGDTEPTGDYNVWIDPTGSETTGLVTQAELENKQDKLTAGDNITIENNVISASGLATQAELENKQDKLIPGDNITIGSNNVISASQPTKTSELTNDSGFITNEYHDATKQNKLVAGDNITLADDGTISATQPTKTSELTNDSGFITNEYHDATKQDKLTAGTNITIDSNNVISATGGGEPDAYIKEASVSGNTLTLTKKDNSTVAFTPEGGSGLQNLSDGTGQGSVQGFYGSATGQGSFCMGYNAQAKAYGSFAFGYASTVSEASQYGITLGYGNENDGKGTVSIGSGNKAHGNDSVAIGSGSKAYSKTGSKQGTNIAIGQDCIAGFNVDTSTVTGSYCIATGQGTCSAGSSSFTEGSSTKAYGAYGSHSEGRGTISTHTAQHAQGTYNLKDTSTEEWYNKGTYADIVGNGNSDTERSNAYTLDWAGNGTFSGTVSSATGADYAEYFEWKDGNPNNEDRVGYIVCLDGDKIVKANTGDDILGICSGTAMVLGDSAEWNWSKRYLTDDFGRIIYEDYDIEHEEIKDENTGKVIEEAWTEHIHAPKQNPDYDTTKVYTKRADRPEWQIVGMMGKLYVRDDGSCVVNGYADVKDGIATKANGKTNMRVMERINDSIVRVLLK